ncbi:hypothetical protein ASG25_01970 [Rhizobium sp. Leaf384]|nr:hypothetical protein ASG58_17035 [Rhizobium sp. Leaf383]KQS80401.1 hypothetical protein ASG25_01970 [Rhizobium sp. Leaf384]
MVADDNEDLRGIYVYNGIAWQKKLDLPADAAQAAQEIAEGARNLALDYRNQARDARDAASNYRDQAAGYVNDIASEKQVPIYGTVAGMASISVPAGILTIQALGRNTMLDTEVTTWKRVASEPDVADAAKFRSSDRFLPNGTTNSANGGWWAFQSLRPRVDMFTGQWTAQSLLDYLRAKMAAGDHVTIACYGDSTTDGIYTTGWTANPVDGSGNAVGNIDHAATAPNAWPAVAQSILRDMYGNNVTFWNAGYVGQKVVSGWAYDNYRKAVISNSAYGIPAATIIDFGLNDVAAAGSQLADFVSEFRRLILLVMAYGTIPIITTCDPIYLNASNTRDHKEVTRQINQAKRAIAAEFRIPLMDKEAAMKHWLQGNRDGYRWAQLQTDGLHFSDVGHRFKGCYFAKEFFGDTVTIQQGRGRKLMTWDSASNYLGDPTAQAAFGNNLHQGANMFWNSAAPKATAMMSFWVWNEDSDMGLVYRGIDGEGYASDLPGSPPYVRVYDILANTGVNKIPAAVGFTSNPSGYHKSDLPYRWGAIPYGLSRISYFSGDGDALYFGNFEFQRMERGVKTRNALKNSGPLRRTFASTPSHAYELVPEMVDGSNIFGAFTTDTVEILADVSMPVGAGFIVAHSNTWGAAGSKVVTMLVRISTTAWRLYAATIAADGTMTLGSTLGTSSTLSVTTDDQKVRLVVSRSGNNQVVNVFEGWGGSSANVLTITTARTAYAMHFAGACGGVYWSNILAAGGGTALVRELSISQ